MFAALLTGVAALLLFQLGEQTKWIDGLRLSAQPRMLPLLALTGMGVFSFTAAFMSSAKDLRLAAAEALIWLRPSEYLLYFILYVGAVPVLGYGPATVLFCPLLAWRAGCHKQQIAFAALFGAGVVVFFKGALSVKIPGAAWYDSLPAALRTLMILNF